MNPITIANLLLIIAKKVFVIAKMLFGNTKKVLIIAILFYWKACIGIGIQRFNILLVIFNLLLRKF